MVKRTKPVVFSNSEGGLLMGNWFPRLYDSFMSPLEKRPVFQNTRKQLVVQASGDILEIGAGTGINFPFYTSNARHVLATDPDPEMLKRMTQKKDLCAVPIDVQTANAESLPFSASAFDTVVATLVFCSISKPQRAIEELYRVLRPGGQLLLFEHVRMDHPALHKAQDLLTPLWKHLCDGCHLNRDTLSLINNSSFSVDQVIPIYKGLFISIKATKFL
jgi:ubiquinone/menaquinone biosynthesis C-methylase UbiE